MLLFLLLVVSNALHIRNLYEVTLYFEVSGSITMMPGNCSYPNPHVPLLQCNLTNSSPAYMQVVTNEYVTPGIVVRTKPPDRSDSWFSGNRKDAWSPWGFVDIKDKGTYMGAGCYSIQINTWTSSGFGNPAVNIISFSEFGRVPPIDNNTLQLEFKLMYAFD